MADTQVGSIIGGRYSVLEKLGEGGMSIVWLARDQRLERLQAIKEIKNNASDATHRADVNLMRKEAHIMKNLDHPNIVHVNDIIDENGALYVIMDYVPGKDLAKIMRETKQASGQPVFAFSQQDVIDWGIQLCDALGYLHTQNPPVIYRDMKPSNVMLQDDGTVKIIDFGIAREFKDSQSVDTMSLGTRGYASPEAAEKLSQTDARSDVYSLGVTLFHLVTGHSPLEYTLQPNLPPIRELNPALSVPLEQTLIRANQWDPNLRQQSMLELRYELENPVEPEDYARMRRINARFKRLWIAGVACLLLGAVCLAGSRFARSKGGSGLMASAREAVGNRDFDAAADYYMKAIEIEPDNIEPYIALVKDVYPGDQAFSSAEVADWKKILQDRRSAIEGSDRYGELNYHAGFDYFFYLEVSDPLKRGADAVASFDEAVAHYQEGNDAFGEAERNTAEMLSFIGQFNDFIRETEQKSLTGEDLQQGYRQYYDMLNRISSDTYFESERGSSTQAAPLVRLTLDQVIVNALGSTKYVKGFKAAGISADELSSLLRRAAQDAESQFELVEASELADQVYNGYSDEGGRHPGVRDQYEASQGVISSTYGNVVSRHTDAAGTSSAAEGVRP